ncbi:YgfZ/GcvT domain-containing protein [Microbulbifer halophilus]|uniref:YgfZ/GcvT domain-containing protein n=1 Tax=Microbulbifer halophilus TaxID=453963 RepID=A0ABW5EBB1_9GAMM|nr:folate-binding protein [Microbulbifer halophilus]MCW8127549.1 folate-binding protein [Microbulbifer halophilus]
MDQQQWQHFLTAEGAIWEDNRAHFPPVESATDDDLQLIDLSPLGAVSAAGPDSQKFLQGQLTCDLVTLPDGSATPGAHCNPKGRAISAFSALKLSTEQIFLRLPRDLVPIARDALAKYAVFFKSELEDIGDRYRWLGLQGKAATERAAELLELDGLTTGQVQQFDCNGEAAFAETLSEQQLALLVPAQSAADLWQRLAQQATPAGYDHWQQRQIEAGIPQLHGAASELFIPQMLNLHLLGGVSFKKGCYTGQEVVARMQYRGAAKRRLYRARCASGELPETGSDIAGENGKSIGNLVNACRSEHGIELLAVLTITKVAAGETLTLADGRKLELQELPYDVEADPLAD